MMQNIRLRRICVLCCLLLQVNLHATIPNHNLRLLCIILCCPTCLLWIGHCSLEWGWADMVEFIAWPTVCANMYRLYCGHSSNPLSTTQADNFGCLFFLFCARVVMWWCRIYDCVVYVFCVVCFCKLTCTQPSQTTTFGYSASSCAAQPVCYE